MDTRIEFPDTIPVTASIFMPGMVPQADTASAADPAGAAGGKPTECAKSKVLREEEEESLEKRRNYGTNPSRKMRIAN